MSEETSSNQGVRALPHNLDAERGVLGSMLLSSEAQLEVMSVLTSQDFYRPSHQAIFTAMSELFAKG
ncbi:MAG: replicative DNA helicase, partial [Coriobacteriia bacterium]|nr:replicative DNA helicase [Coriobacteriia bacterium]